MKRFLAVLLVLCMIAIILPENMARAELNTEQKIEKILILETSEDYLRIIGIWNHGELSNKAGSSFSGKDSHFEILRTWLRNNPEILEREVNSLEANIIVGEITGYNVNDVIYYGSKNNTVEVAFKNTGNIDHAFSITLKLYSPDRNSNFDIDKTQDVFLNAGESQTKSFRVNSNMIGNWGYQFELLTNGKLLSIFPSSIKYFQVKIEPKENSPETKSDSPINIPVPTVTPTSVPINSPTPVPVVIPTSESDSEIEKFEDIEDIEVNIVNTPQKISLNIPLNFTFNQDLHYGNRGTDVLYLQRLLNASGVTVANYGWGSLGRETEYFGVLTYNAVKSFQRKYGLFVNGVVDNTTRIKLNAILTEYLVPMKPILLYPFNLFLLEESTIDFGGIGTPGSIVYLYRVVNGRDILSRSATVNSKGIWKIQGVSIPTGELIFKLVAKKNGYSSEPLVFEEYRGNWLERLTAKNTTEKPFTRLNSDEEKVFLNFLKEFTDKILNRLVSEEIQENKKKLGIAEEELKKIIRKSPTEVISNLTLIFDPTKLSLRMSAITAFNVEYNKSFESLLIKDQFIVKSLEIKNYKIAINYYQDFLKKMDEEEFSKELVAGIHDTLMEFDTKLIPFISSLASFGEIVSVINSSKKIENNEEISPYEESLLAKFTAKKLLTNRSMAYNVGIGIVTMPTFITEFLSLNYLAKPIILSVQKGLVSGLQRAGIDIMKKKTTSVVVNAIINISVGAGIQTVGNLPELAERTAEYLLPNYNIVGGELGDILCTSIDEKVNVTFSEALKKATGTLFVDYSTERLGYFMGNPLKFLKKGFLGSWLTKKGITESANVITKTLHTGGWNGIVNEIIEEEIAEVFNSKIEGRDYFNVFTEEGLERLMTEGLIISAFGGMTQIPAVVINQVSPIQYRNSLKNILKAEGFSNNIVNSISSLDFKILKVIVKDPASLKYLATNESNGSLSFKDNLTITMYAEKMVSGIKNVSFDVSSTDFFKSINHGYTSKGRNISVWPLLNIHNEQQLAEEVKNVVEKGLSGDPSVKIGIQSHKDYGSQYFFSKDTGTNLGEIFIAFDSSGKLITVFPRTNVWTNRNLNSAKWIFDISSVMRVE